MNQTVIDTCVNAVDIGLKEVHLVLDVTRAAGMDIKDGPTKKHIFFTPPFQVLKRVQDNNINIVRSETLVNGAVFGQY